jgi:hypothetical protein
VAYVVVPPSKRLEEQDGLACCVDVGLKHLWEFTPHLQPPHTPYHHNDKTATLETVQTIKMPRSTCGNLQHSRKAL